MELLKTFIRKLQTGFTPLEHNWVMVNNFTKRTHSVKKSDALTGFTLIEVLLVIGIFILLATTGVVVNQGFYQSFAFNTERQALISHLEKIRSRAMTNMHESAFGIKLQNFNQYLLFQGQNYNSRLEAYDETVYTAPGISITGPTEIIFQQLSGRTVGLETILLTDGTRNANVSINTEGTILW